ncbi:MAG: hypothetical protein H7147_12505 [Frankiaceae bacterium]|nr:hypothetical protein [Arenimonas sp.]
MKSFVKPTLAALSLLLGIVGHSALAQTTDGYHTIMVFPLVVDTASFTQRFQFRNPNDEAINIETKYFPANGTAQAAPLSCNPVNVAAGKMTVVLTLKALCPGLNPVGSHFGFLYTRESSATKSLPYTGFSRVANPQGLGYTVETFPPHTFTSADSAVIGIRRLAATASTPAYQSNCFVGNLNDVNAITQTNLRVHYTVYDDTTAKVAEGDINLLPGKMQRMLDVFSYAGLGAVANYNDAQITFQEFSDVASDEPGMMAFCTVQDNTTVGSDFRIAKQERGAGVLGYPGDRVGAQDNHVNRETLVTADGLSRQFTILPGANSNTHVMYFRHPDYIQCEILIGGVRADPSYGLEMVLRNQDGDDIAGGQDQTGWGRLYLGDKTQVNGGSNSRYTIEVQDAERNTGATRPYTLHCQSGSGHTLGDLIRYHEPIITPF